MQFPFFISKRYIFSKKDSRFVTFISSISIIGIALGVATLIIALSVLQGFEKTIVQKIVDFDSHIQITSYKNILPDYKLILPRIENLLPPSANIIPYASNLAIISSKNVQEGVNVKGIFPGSPLNIKNNIVAGSFNIDEANTIVIGKKLADKLLVKAEDKITLFALNENQIPSAENPPNILRLKITGIFESGMAEYDDLYTYVNINDAQELFGIGDNINGYDISVSDISKIDSLANTLSGSLRYPHTVRTIYSLHKNIFTWIQLQKEPIPIILGLIIIVAAFNIIGTLLMIVLEKTGAIGILKSLGASKRQITSVFIYQGIFLSAAGIILGNLLAIILMQIQIQYDVISLPSSVYFMSKVPFELSLQTFAGVSLITLILCMLTSVIPSYVASKINPISSLRFS